MLSKFIAEKKHVHSKHNHEELKILFIYRYLSILITSTFYLLNHSQHSIIRKIFIIGCLVLSSTILSYLYFRDEKSEKDIKILLLIETIGNSALLIPSGGVNSPFIWYALNTILISSIFLKRIHCWINLLIYILAYCITAWVNVGVDINILELLRQESNLILSLIMIVAAVQVWSVYVKKIKENNKKLKKINIQLKSANHRVVESVEHIKSLYKSVNILTNQGNKEGIIKLLYKYTKEITKSNTVFYYDLLEGSAKFIIDNENEYLIKILEKSIVMDLNDILENKIPIEVSVLDSKFAMMPIRTTHKNYGILGCEITNSNNAYQLQFLVELISTTFERLYLEGVNERLMISEEQNRIANEIHDSVLQRLFSLSCGIFSLMKRMDNLDINDIKQELNFIRRTINSVMKELRSKIYGLCWKKSGTNSFVVNIKRYIDETKKLNNINIPFSIVGNDEILSCEQKKSLYRIICEGISNAVRHGKAKNIEINLDINSQCSILNIIDDGTGFELNNINKDTANGLGIRNLYQLTESLGGNIKIDSNLGKGTSIEVMVPNNMELMKGEKVPV